MLTNVRYGQAEDGPDVQGAFGQVLRNQRHQAGVVRAGRYLAEDHVIALHKHFHAEQASSPQGLGDGACHVFRCRNCG